MTLSAINVKKIKVLDAPSCCVTETFRKLHEHNAGQQMIPSWTTENSVNPNHSQF